MDRSNILSKLLCPPGNGVFTVHTAQEKKHALHNSLYGITDPNTVEQQWQHSIAGICGDKSSLLPSKPTMIGICSDTGGGIQRGANWGPLFLRSALHQYHPELTNYLDIGDVRVIPHLLHDKYLNAATIAACRESLYDNPSCELPVSPLSIAEYAAEIIYSNIDQPRLFSIGGDHSCSYPVVKACLQAFNAKQHNNKSQHKCAVIHFDAHTDLLDKRLGIDLNFSTWTYHILQYLNSPADLVQIGIRSSGKDKQYWENKLGIKQIWAADIIDNGIEKITEQLLSHLQAQNITHAYISFDLDALDAKYMTATGTPELSGMTPEHVLALLTAIGKHFNIIAADVMELAPMVDNQVLSPFAQPDESLRVAADIAAALLELLSLSD